MRKGPLILDLNTADKRRAYINSHLDRCLDCGNTDNRVLTFHHREPGRKWKNVKSMISSTHTQAQIDREIAKCDVLCLNCHHLRHWEIEHQKG